ncbi:hypothetical protein LG634_29100 [Streptomyces bambusae]|uniref:hypothetical protein n=1 Tax=Streptomyces bambusae TaxID=1550616 RepID=UPI001CFF45D4|nr:hypothetical protein [Streptomyces bambusae]MCB5168864.1 hypothetical protein [Streptomyces bambusae]
MARTTPPRPFDASADLPPLAPLARTATRLHPRAGAPSTRDSSVGGPLLWPATEPWPHCDGPHVWDRRNPAPSPDGVRLQRRITEDAVRRADGDPGALQYTPEELADHQRAREGRPWPDGPVPLLPVAQLYLRDVPSLRPPGPADLLQVLWCPFEHPAVPRTEMFWRTAASVTDVLAAPPEPPVVQFSSYLPQPCLLFPEQVTEYPHSAELEDEVRRQMEDCHTWQLDVDPHDVDPYEDEPTPQDVYDRSLSIAPGWKTGGWTRWGLTDPYPRLCGACGTAMDPLLTIASSEWGETSTSWIPDEDRDVPASALNPYPEQPTKVEIADGYDLQLYTCPSSPEHPHFALVQ